MNPGIDAKQFRRHIIVPVLENLGMNSEAAVRLLLGTAAVESRMGKYLVQLGGGPAVGIYQMEPATHDSLWENWLGYRNKTAQGVKAFVIAGSMRRADELVGNLFYATAMTRIRYRRVSEALPDADDIRGLAKYWKKHYNTAAGKGTPVKFIRAYNLFIKGYADV